MGTNNGAEISTGTQSAEKSGLQTHDRSMTAIQDGNGATAIGTHSNDARVDHSAAQTTLHTLGLGNFEITDLKAPGKTAGAPADRAAGAEPSEAEMAAMGLIRPKIHAAATENASMGQPASAEPSEADMAAMGLVRPKIHAPAAEAPAAPHEITLPPGVSWGVKGGGEAHFPAWHPPTEGATAPAEAKPAGGHDADYGPVTSDHSRDPIQQQPIEQLPSGTMVVHNQDSDFIQRKDGSGVLVNSDGPQFFDAYGKPMQMEAQNPKFAASPEKVSDGTVVTGYNFEQFSGAGTIKFANGEKIEISHGRVDMAKTEQEQADSPVGSRNRVDSTANPAADMLKESVGKPWDDAFARHDFDGMTKIASKLGRDLQDELAKTPSSFMSTGDMVDTYNKMVNDSIATEHAGMLFVLHNDQIRIVEGKDITDPSRVAQLKGQSEADLNKQDIYSFDGGFIQKLPGSKDIVMSVPPRAHDQEFKPGFRSL